MEEWRYGFILDLGTRCSRYNMRVGIIHNEEFYNLWSPVS
jgi:hypothetical protein